MHLLAIFWSRQHYSGTFVYRTAFMRDMASGGPYFSKLLLNAMLFSASRHYETTASESVVMGQPFRQKFERLLHGSGSHVLFESTVTSIQALLVMSDVLLSWCDERSLSWHYMGIAVNMIVDLGIHVQDPKRPSTKNFSAEDLEVHRRVFWSAFGTPYDSQTERNAG
jgi:hypothetical protein